ncbi:MAG: hypothetical protein JJ992_03385, partial [Planctomycetes bacterium]|nr:hypothetical protein [Planctomycetota bacterium]
MPSYPVDPQLQLGDYLRIAKRRLPYLIVPFLILSVAAISLISLLPPIYRSTGIIAIDSQQIPDDLVRSTVRGSADQRIGFISQLVMTSARLEEIIRDFRLYPKEVSELPMQTVVDEFRKNVRVDAVQDPYSASTTISFTVAFDHPDPHVARAVATRLTNLFLNENAENRRARATETADFLREETARLEDQVRVFEKQIADFKQNNSDALPEHLTMRVSMLQQAEFDLRAVQRDISSGEQELRFLKTQLTTGASILKPGGDARSEDLTPLDRLRLLSTQLRDATASYTAAHPDVIRLKRLVAQARADVSAHQAAADGDGNIDGSLPANGTVQQNIVSAETRLTSLREQERDLGTRIKELQSQILRTADVEQRLSEIRFKYERTSKDYDDIRAKL